DAQRRGARLLQETGLRCRGDDRLRPARPHALLHDEEALTHGGGRIQSARRTALGRVAMDITYRPAKQEDLEEAERVAQQSGNELRVRHGGRPSSAPPSIAFPEFCLAQDPAGLWVAEDGDTILGFGFSWMTEKFWFLSQLFVRPEIQAKGIGQALLSKTLMQAERNGAANRALITFAYNIASIGFYLKNGLYPREPLHRMAAPAQAVAQDLPMPVATSHRLRSGLNPANGLLANGLAGS